jgi:hypothetical protein
MNPLYVTGVSTREIKELEDRTYDIVIAAVGYEPRSRAIAEHLPMPEHGLAIPFLDQQEHAFKENKELFEKRGYNTPELSHDEQPEFVRQWVLERWRAAQLVGELRIAVDISSMTRRRMATLVEVISSLDPAVRVLTDYLYTPQIYREPPPEPLATLTIGPVTPEFAGWTPDLDTPTCAVVGLGYEANTAAGAAEFLDADRAIAYAPRGRDPRFRADVDRANESISDYASVIKAYEIEDPLGLLLDLDRLAAGVTRHSRLLFVPLGPKIFALCSLLVARLYRPRIAVWRVRNSELRAPQYIESAGRVCGLRASNAPFAGEDHDRSEVLSASSSYAAA